MSDAVRRYVLIETLISVIINSVLSACATWLAFSGLATIGLWGARGLALDFIPQSFMVGLMSALMPTLLTRRRRLRGRALRIEGPPSLLPRNLILRALWFALAAVVVGGGAAVLLLWRVGPETYGFATVVAMKVSYGAVVALVVTPNALSAALRED